MRLIERALGLLAGAALFLMMALTFVDVVGRKLLDASIPGSLELTELLMTVVVFAALPLASLRGEHVIFDLLDRLLPRSWSPAQHVLSHLVSALLLAGAAWLVLERAARTLEQGDRTAQLAIGLAPLQYGAAAMLALTASMHLWLALRGPAALAAPADAAGPDGQGGPPAGAL